jgi:hypothetical protein
MQSENLRVIVASYIGGFERSLHSIVLILAGVGLAGLILTVFLVHMCLKLGLRPLDDLGRQLCSTQPAHLHQRFPTAQLPWRKSEARSEKGHTGLGLAVVAACTERLGETCRATLQDQLLRIEIRWNG